MKRLSHSSNSEKTKSAIKIQPSPKFIREALYLDIHHTPGIPAKVFADRLGISYGQLVNTINPNLPFKFSCRHLPGLVKMCENSETLRFLAKEAGYCLYRLPKSDCTGDLLLPLFELDENLNNFRCVLRDILSQGKNGTNLDLATQRADFLLGSLLSLRAVLLNLRKEKTWKR